MAHQSDASVPSSITQRIVRTIYLQVQPPLQLIGIREAPTERCPAAFVCVCVFVLFFGGIGGLLGAAVGVVNGYITWYNYGKNLRKLGHGAPTTRFLQATSSWNYTPK